MSTDALVAAGLVAATALHLGFQLTVTLVVYPTLAQVSADRWTQAHARHSRRIVPVVLLAYAALLVALVASAVRGPISAAWVLAAAGSAVAVGTTLLVAGPAHTRLARHDPTVLRLLLRADRVRTLGAALAAVGAVAWAVGLTVG